jgi:hypothetical protein
MTVQPGQLDMHSAQPELDMKSKPAQADVWLSAVKVDLDTTACRATYGLKSTAAVVAEMAKKALQQAEEGTAKRARIGTQLVKNATKTNVFAANAKADLSEMPESKIGLAAVPDVKVTVHPSEIHGENDVGSLEVSFQIRPVDVQYTPAVVHTYLDRVGSVKIWATEGKYDIYA